MTSFLHNIKAKRILKKGIFLFVLVFTALSLPAMAKRITSGFRIAKLLVDVPSHVPSLTSDWDLSLLNQDFFFLGKGAQSFAFASKEYVIKFFRSDHGKIEELFQSCLLAYEHLPQETGLLYLHLHKTENVLPTIVCKDAVGRKWTMDLNRYSFAVQKKGSDFQQTLLQAGPDELKQRVQEFVQLIRTRASKKIANADSNLCRNFGFLEQGAIELDFGNYRYSPDLDEKKETQKFVKKLKKWCEKNAPDYVECVSL